MVADTAMARACNILTYLSWFLGLSYITWTWSIVPLTQRVTWIATACEFTAPMTLQRWGDRIPRIRVDAPVTVFEPIDDLDIDGQTWAGVAHRFPPHTMYDTSRQTVYKWWLGIGGTGTVLVEPCARWPHTRPEFSLDSFLLRR